MHNTFGDTLKEWRGRRRMSQLDLGLAANVSARHISFLETGRSRPSRSMVRLLSESLEMPHGARNAFLGAAGFAPAYRKRDLDDTDMAHVRAAVDWTMERHDPFPAMALDRHWNVVKANRTGGLLLAGAGVAEGDSLLEAITDADRLQDVLVNWQEVAEHMIVRLRTESAHLGGDAFLDTTVERLEAALGPRIGNGDGPLPAIIPARYRVGEQVLSFFSTIAQFGSAEDIALSELRIELLFPSDDQTRAMLLSMVEHDA
ncbi:helix-turn-helix domain-containing protein [Hoeflea sp.]|uniref:MmyB family transcriptional regulator n=1 Tax=Hoeflea sp. TaxID=1940281 RepID=UPI003B01267F